VDSKGDTVIRVYFVRHAEPEHGWGDDRTQPLTVVGKRSICMLRRFQI
jgi:2,3-bisphosphoglycerate-dependent phosphoglycerate mutase